MVTDVGRRDEFAEQAQVSAGLHLAADVDFGGGDIADQYCCQTGPDSLRCEESNLFGYLLFDRCGYCGSIEHLWHIVLQDNRIASPRRGQFPKSMQGEDSALLSTSSSGVCFRHAFPFTGLSVFVRIRVPGVCFGYIAGCGDADTDRPIRTKACADRDWTGIGRCGWAVAIPPGRRAGLGRAGIR